MAIPSLKFNAPLTLSFTAASLAVLIIGYTMNGGKDAVLLPFTVGGAIDLASPLQWFRFFSHILGHEGLSHFFSNFMLILLLGPMLEEKYGAWNLLLYILITALITGVVQSLFFSTYLLGASGIVFMFIVLASLSNFKSGEIPVTFILIIFIYLGNEILMATSFKEDHVSHYAHIMGGVCGAIFGFFKKQT